MTPEQLWKSLEPQVEAIERELMNHGAINETMSDALLTGVGVYTVGINQDSLLLELTSLGPQGIMLIDECEPIMCDEMEVAILGIGAPRRSAKMSTWLATTLTCWPSIVEFDWPDIPEPPPEAPRHHKALSKKNYTAPRQSFRGRMRSVNRNR